MIQFAYNTSIYKIIKQIPFFINYRFYSNIYKISTIGPDNLYTTIKVEHFKFIKKRLKNKLLFIKDRIAKYYNNKKMKESYFEKRESIFIS